MFCTIFLKLSAGIGFLNDKGLLDFGKRMIISKLLGGCSLPPSALPVATALG
jgi:hypothetical protein